MVSAGQVVTPLEWGVVAPPLVPEGTVVLPFDVGASGGYGEQPYLEEYGVPQETDQGAAASPAGSDEVIIIQMGEPGPKTIPGSEPGVGSPAQTPAPEAPKVEAGVFRQLLRDLAGIVKDWWTDTKVVDPLSGEPITPPPTRDRYVLNRGLATASTYTQRTFGRTIDAWVVGEILAARASGQMTFRIAVLGSGDGNTERELFERVAPVVRALGMRLEVTTLTLPDHPMTPENRAAIRAFESAGIYLSPQFGDFDAGPLPFEDIDIVYAVMSTVYSENPVAVTAKIHDALRKPTSVRPGGQAFFMYRYGHQFPATVMSTHAFDLMGEGVDVVVVRPQEQLSAYAHMTRISPDPLDDLGGLLDVMGRGRPFIGYRPTRGAGPMSAMTSGEIEVAFDLFSRGAGLLFSANGLDPSVLSEEAYLRSFGLLRPGIQAGLPIYPDAVAVAFGSRSLLDAIHEHGDTFADHLPDTSGPTQHDLAKSQGPRMRINF